jgi:hypothetical protein
MPHLALRVSFCQGNIRRLFIDTDRCDVAPVSIRAREQNPMMSVYGDMAAHGASTPLLAVRQKCSARSRKSRPASARISLCGLRAIAKRFAALR